MGPQIIDIISTLLLEVPFTRSAIDRIANSPITNGILGAVSQVGNVLTPIEKELLVRGHTLTYPDFPYISRKDYKRKMGGPSVMQDCSVAKVGLKSIYE